MLLENKAAPNLAKTTDGVTPLHMAAKKGHASIIALLINVWTDQIEANALNAAGIDPEHAAFIATTPHLEHTINIEHYKGATALHLACMHNQPAIVRLLCTAGARITAEDTTGKTPLDYARLQNNDTAHYLVALRNKQQEESEKNTPCTKGFCPICQEDNQILRPLLSCKKHGICDECMPGYREFCLKKNKFLRCPQCRSV